MVKLSPLTVSELDTWGRPRQGRLQASNKKDNFQQLFEEKKKKMIYINKGLVDKMLKGFGVEGPRSAACEDLRVEAKRRCVSAAQRRTLTHMFLLPRVMFLLRTDRQTAPVHTGAIQGNCVKVTSRKEKK